jgi:hypothetical protein
MSIPRTVKFDQSKLLPPDVREEHQRKMREQRERDMRVRERLRAHPEWHGAYREMWRACLRQKRDGGPVISKLGCAVLVVQNQDRLAKWNKENRDGAKQVDVGASRDGAAAGRGLRGREAGAVLGRAVERSFGRGD